MVLIETFDLQLDIVWTVVLTVNTVNMEQNQRFSQDLDSQEGQSRPLIILH